MIIKIELHTDLPTRAQNKLRYAIELGEWRRKWEQANNDGDCKRLDQLQREYERIGLP